MEVRSVKIVRCLNCKSVFPDIEMTIPGHCPHCVCGNLLEEKENTDERWWPEDLQQLWLIFGDIPMDPVDEVIEDSFIGFPAGTHREEIWHWFDERYPGGVHALMEEVD